MKTTINLLLLFLACTAANVGLSLYYFESKNKETKPPTKPASAVGYEATAVAAALANVHKQAVYRDTVTVQQVLRIQHHLNMHGQRVPMCPDCRAGNRTAGYKYTMDDFR
jgi:hypothetical protein